MPSGFGIPDARDNIKNDTRRNMEQEKQRQLQIQFQQMTLMQLLMELKKKDKDKDRKKKLLMALLQKILNSFKKNASNMSESDAADISKAGNASNNKDHGGTAKGK